MKILRRSIGHLHRQPPSFPLANIVFGECTIPKEHIFYYSSHNYGLVNLSPFKRNHVLLIPFRKVQHFQQLSAEEIKIFLEDAQRVEQIMLLFKKCHYTIFCQNGRNAWQTVKHVHFHFMPREEQAIEDHRSKKRSFQDMADEAMRLRGFVAENFKEWDAFKAA